MINSLIEWYRPSGPVDVEQLADAITAFAFEGLATGASGAVTRASPTSP